MGTWGTLKTTCSTFTLTILSAIFFQPPNCQLGPKFGGFSNKIPKKCPKNVQVLAWNFGFGVFSDCYCSYCYCDCFVIIIIIIMISSIIIVIIFIIFIMIIIGNCYYHSLPRWFAADRFYLQFCPYWTVSFRLFVENFYPRAAFQADGGKPPWLEDHPRTRKWLG